MCKKKVDARWIREWVNRPRRDPFLRITAEKVDTQLLNTPDFSDKCRIVCRDLDYWRKELGFGHAWCALRSRMDFRMLAINLTEFPSSDYRDLSGYQDQSFIMINPEMTWHSRDYVSVWSESWSRPTMMNRVSRFAEMRLRWMNEEGTEYEWNEHQIGIDLGQCLQTELDRLHGIVQRDILENGDGMPFEVTRDEFMDDPDSFLSYADYHFMDVTKARQLREQSQSKEENEDDTSKEQGKSPPLS